MEPLVSVCCITYNHEKYIREAIEGFLMQKTTFPIEIIIHDDASTDKTADIVREYEKKHPEIIKPIYQTENQWSKGIKPSPTYVWPKAKGRYIALCEGDDYWTDPLKLQKQVDFLEKNEGYSICHHKVKLEINKQLKNDYLNKHTKETTTIFDLAESNYIRTCSVMFRSISFEPIKSVLAKSEVLDYIIHLYNAQYGTIGYLSDTMGVYRHHNEGVWSSKQKHETLEKWSSVLEKLLNMFDEKTNAIIVNQYVSCIYRLVVFYRSTGNKTKEDYYFQLCCKYPAPLSKLLEAEISKYKDSTSYKIGYKLVSLASFLKKRIIPLKTNN